MLDLDSLAAFHGVNPQAMRQPGVQGLPSGETREAYKPNFMDRLRTMPNFNVTHGFKGVDQGDRIMQRLTEINARRAERGLPPIGGRFMERFGQQGGQPATPGNPTPGFAPGEPSPQAPAGGGNFLEDLWGRVQKGLNF